MSSQVVSPFCDKDICHFSQDGTALEVMDQTLLPGEERYITLRSAAQVAEAISKLRVRGAPLIGIAAAMGVCVAMQEAGRCDAFEEVTAIIGHARPTAVNLSWAMQRMDKVYRAHLQELPQQDAASQDSRLEGLVQRLHHEAIKIKEEDAHTCEAIGREGSRLITPGMGLLTHCNAGHLATGHYGTALAPIYWAQRSGKAPRVFADETRPLLQGARLTSYELQHSGVDVTLLCDGMAASVMSRGLVQMVLVGCDRVALNGDVANKIGTYGVAVMAHHFGIPFYVCCPLSSCDPFSPAGGDIEIEQRSPQEVTSMWYRQPMAPQGCKVMNPAFDITPHALVTAYITEVGVLRPDELSRQMQIQ